MKVAYIVRSWPRLSQTFVVNEVLALERIGVDISIFAMVRTDEKIVQPQVADVKASVRYLDAHSGAGPHLRVLVRSPRRYLATLASALRQRELFGGYTQSGPFAAFHRAVVVADGANGSSHIHAHFAHDPALIGLLARRLTDLPFTFTAHARDLYQIPDAALVARTQEASAVVSCSQTNADHIVEVVGQSGPPIEVIYHGVDLETFRPSGVTADNDVPLVVSVGRLVEKKGFDTLLHACAQVAAAGPRFQCEIYGDGPDLADLEALRTRLGLDGVVTFCGSRTQAELLTVYQRADVFALTPRVTADGDRDGVPNVLVEAMACGLAVVTTPVGGISELVEHGADGLLVPEHDAGAVAAGLTQLLADAAWRHDLGAAAVTKAARFDSRAAARRLAALFTARATSCPTTW